MKLLNTLFFILLSFPNLYSEDKIRITSHIENIYTLKISMLNIHSERLVFDSLDMPCDEMSGLRLFLIDCDTIEGRILTEYIPFVDNLSEDFILERQELFQCTIDLKHRFPSLGSHVPNKLLLCWKYDPPNRLNSNQEFVQTLVVKWEDTEKSTDVR